ncbi:putative Dual specificity protein phosphatase [Leptomonas seymouri]|uniref:Putative Dual specificity protein phosphatase n=1 Tax=Leptomonas seymouri TaxID=5684 RepID=A0A0N1PDK0_LEPSE|nr:putative Dual specificity protein phosphatase [Leptomonas seymouri]|eukprot:KPI89912.1 putative Dual specificity protein phosphatase [Leptomonas seymouri]
MAVVDICTFFRILRFISAQPQLSTLAAAAAAVEQAPEDVLTQPVAQSDIALSPSATDDGAPPLPPKRSQMGASVAVGNRIRIPERLKEPLEEYRRMATTPPISHEGLAAARQRVQAILEELCSELGDAAVSKALRDDVFAHREDEIMESDSTNYIKDTRTTNFGPQYMAKARVSNSSEMQEVVPGLWCGSWRQANSLEVLTHYGITHVCCCIDTQPRFPDQFIYLQIPATDAPTYNMQKHFAQAFEFIENALVKCHSNVLVHCGAGISRAPTIVSSYLIKKLHISSTAAMQLVQHHRYFASPNIGFREQLHTYAKSLNVDEVSPSERGKCTNAGFKQAASAFSHTT